MRTHCVSPSGIPGRRARFLGAILSAALTVSPMTVSQSPTGATGNAGTGDSKLSQNYPNPFNPSTTIQYSIEEAGMVSLKLFNLLGVEVATLVNGRQEAGRYEVRLDAGGSTPGITSGVYFYRLETGAVRSTRKMVLME